MAEDSALSLEAARSAPAVIVKITIDDLVACIGAGLRDFVSAPDLGLFFGGVYAVGGVALVTLFAYLELPYIGYPLAMGFALIAPFVCAGCYEVSRLLESEGPIGWGQVLGAVWRRAGKELGWLALVSLFTLIVWVDFAVFFFLLFYGLHVPDMRGFLMSVFSTFHGFAFAVLGNLIGAVIGMFVFSITVVSAPMLVDREVDFITAMITSVRAVVANPIVMCVWAATIGLLLGMSILSCFLGLFVILPVLGHASWHLYRRVVV